MKRGQLTGRPIMYALFGILAILILVFGTVQITKWVSTSKGLELTTFLSSLQNVVKKQGVRGYGSVDEKIIALPRGVETLCLVDRSKEISGLINLELSKELNKYENKNVFFEPFDKFDPSWVDGFELGDDENPLCLRSVGGTARISITSRGNKSLVSTFRGSEKKIDCVSVLYNSHPNDSIDIVFLSYGYNEFDDFRKDVSEYVGVFLTTEPFKSNLEKINFYRIDKLDELSCEIGAWIKCDEFEVKKLSSFCPNDYVVILVDRSKAKDLLNPVRSSAVSNMEKINTAEKKLVVLHEFGHIFGGLADEYVDEKYYGGIAFDANNYPNCDLPPECTGFEGVEGTGCFEGCSLGRFSRPTFNSLMRNFDTEMFGPFNEKILIDKLDSYEVNRGTK